MKRRQDAIARMPAAGKVFDSRAGRTSSMQNAHVAPDTHVTAGQVLWTLTQDESTAQARQWITPTGYELELQIWSGPRVVGEEDLCWSQLFAREEALSEAALAKKRQLVASGWLETIDATPR